MTFVLFMMNVVKLTAGGILVSAATHEFNVAMTEKLEPLIESQLADKPEIDFRHFPSSQQFGASGG